MSEVAKPSRKTHSRSPLTTLIESNLHKFEGPAEEHHHAAASPALRSRCNGGVGIHILLPKNLAPVLVHLDVVYAKLRLFLSLSDGSSWAPI
jgi:hypothetical protein